MTIIAQVHRHEYTLLNQQETRKISFREDVAFIRALAIIAVLLFHLWPNVFRIGFLGVDIFFVISGYLIFGILLKSSKPPFQKIHDFYQRRIKRICPLYFFVIFITGLGTLFVYSRVYIATFFLYYVQAVYFSINLELLKTENNYFAEETADIPFLHTWSLGVEMQFYLVAPVIFFLCTRHYCRYPVGSLILLGICAASLAFQLNAEETSAFYHPFSRIWQFGCGMLSCFYSEKPQKNVSSWLCDMISFVFLFIFLVMFLPFIHHENFTSTFQIITTVSASLFFLSASYGSFDWSKFQLGYTATISYALYLVHYPVLRFLEYLTEIHNLPLPVPWVALLLTIVLSVAAHHCYEKPMQLSDNWTVVKQMVIYLALASFVGFFWESIKPTCVANEAYLKQRGLKSQYPLSGGKFVPFFDYKQPFGHYQYNKSTGNISVVIIGNSWSNQQAHIVREILSPNITSSMDLFGVSTHNFVLHPIANKSEYIFNFIEKTKPTFIFLLQRYVDQHKDNSKFLGDNDTILHNYIKGIDRIWNYTDHIFIEDEQPFPCKTQISFFKKFLDELNRRKDLRHFHLSYNKTHAQNTPVQQRLRRVIEHCGKKCSLIHVQEPFIDQKKHLVRIYNEKTNMAYYDSGCHLTPTALKMIVKPFREAIGPYIKPYLGNV